MNRAEVYKNLPLYMDELTNTEPKDLSDMAYQLPNGVQRNRLTSKGNVERFRGAPWKLLTSTTANNDMISRIGLYKAMPEAEAQRILAIKSVRINFVSKDETDDFSSALIANHGHAGPIYMRYVIENIDAVKALLISTQRKLDNAAGLTAENRFWSIGAAVTITGLIIAKKIGLVGFEIAPIANWIVTAMKKSRADSVMLAGDVESVGRTAPWEWVDVPGPLRRRGPLRPDGLHARAHPWREGADCNPVTATADGLAFSALTGNREHGLSSPRPMSRHHHTPITRVPPGAWRGRARLDWTGLGLD
jgi:hypothetical protein